MLKAGALYLAIVISLIVSIVLGSMIYLTFFFRGQSASFDRQGILRQELEAGITLLKTLEFAYTEADTILPSTLYSGDSILVHKRPWGLYDIGYVKSYIQKDTLSRSIMMGLPLQDSLVLYVADEDRPLSVSGKTAIIGDAQLPKSGIQPAYVDSRYYDGHKDIVQGKKSDSDLTLPKLHDTRLQYLRELYRGLEKDTLPPLVSGDIQQSFYRSALIYRNGAATLLDGVTIAGNVIIMVDSTLHITAQTRIQDALIIARSITIEKGFEGSAQFLAVDSIVIEDEVQLRYPSAVGILKKEGRERPTQIKIGQKCLIEGTLFYYEDKRAAVPGLVSIDKDTRIDGDVTVYGLLQYEKGVQLIGTTSCYRFLIKRPASIYENFLVDITLDRKKLSPYYLRSFLWEPSKKPVSASVIKSLDTWTVE